MNTYTIALTVGDCNGIGPEVVLRSIQRRSHQEDWVPLLVGPLSVFRYYSHRLGIRVDLRPVTFSELLNWRHRLSTFSSKTIPVLESSKGAPRISPGALSSTAGRIAARAIRHAVTLTQMGIADAVVTAPVSKQAMHKAGVLFPGQTEMLQELTSAPRAGMMLVSKAMRVGLVTTHTPIRDVAAAISRTLLRERIETFYHALLADWKIRKPRLAVLGLNPHAGEGGDMGKEEVQLIAPVISDLRQQSWDVQGPFPADAFFGTYLSAKYDAIIAMYHDQGLIPLKMSSFGKAVNVTVGLPIVRTSPDHGTAFDIAGKGVAEPGSMIQAIRLACLIAGNRKNIRSAPPRDRRRTHRKRPRDI